MKRTTTPVIRHLHNTIKVALDFVEYVGLLVIAVATTFAASQEVMQMLVKGVVHLADLLLLFLYLEVLAMVGIYFKTGQLPVRFPLYIAMVAIARHIIIDLKEMTDFQLLAATFSIVVLAVAVLLVRYGHARFPYSRDGVGDGDSDPLEPDGLPPPSPQHSEIHG